MNPWKDWEDQDRREALMMGIEAWKRGEELVISKEGRISCIDWVPEREACTFMNHETDGKSWKRGKVYDRCLSVYVWVEQ